MSIVRSIQQGSENLNMLFGGHLRQARSKLRRELGSEALAQPLAAFAFGIDFVWIKVG
jgi:hypothetical protein